MYISEFWCGVIFTILLEVAALVIYGIVDSMKKKKKK